ncbi:hypothetical protein [Nocardia sp. NPDC058497]|uniref:hypothetical protein n=1 Tax=Nocardia sp. NPDC058497 TaxID=3346529 RepID=UPI00365125C8
MPAVFLRVSATPPHLRARPVEVPVSYWFTWLGGLAVLLVPAVVLAMRPRTRRVAAGYVVAAGLAAVVLAGLVVGFELGGFAPA